MSQAQVAIQSARNYLNDTQGVHWSDAILMPFLQEAFGELIQDLDLNSSGVLKYQTSPITVPAGTLTLPSQPTNILEPISMQERNPGEGSSFFEQMIKVNFLPEEDQDGDLTFWAWLQETIMFIGSTSTKEVILRYKGSLMSPQLLTDPIGIIYGERYLGPRIAALAKDSVGQNSKSLMALAENNKYKLIQRSVLSDQTPVRRRGYRSNSLGFPGRSSIPVSIGGGGGTILSFSFSDNEIPVGAIDGVNTSFTLANIPNPTSSLELFLGGALQDQGIDYTLVGVNITFAVAPQLSVGNTLRAWYRY